MIVADFKCALLRERHVRRIRLRQLAHEVGELLVIEDFAARRQLLQMLLRQLYECREDDGGCCAGGAEILVLDGCVDAGVCGVLYSLQYGKQPPEHVRAIGALFVQFHGQYLLWAER